MQINCPTVPETDMNRSVYFLSATAMATQANLPDGIRRLLRADGDRWPVRKRVGALLVAAFVVLVAAITMTAPAIAQPPTAGNLENADSQRDTGRLTEEIVFSGELEDDWIDRLQALPELRKLTIAHPVNLSENSVARIANLQRLEAFHGEAFPIDSPLADATAKALAGIPSLRSLSLKATGITDEGIRALTASSLTELSLHGEERLADTALEHAAAIRNLQKLTVHSTPINAEGLKHLQACQRLKELSLLRVICR